MRGAVRRAGVGRIHFRRLRRVWRIKVTLLLGYEDLNHNDSLRHAPALQTAVGRDVDMADASPLCRLENSIDAKSLWRKWYHIRMVPGSARRKNRQIYRKNKTSGLDFFLVKAARAICRLCMIIPLDYRRRH